MKIRDLSRIILEFNSLIDRGAHVGISITEVEKHIAKGDLFDWLRQTFENRIDLSSIGEAESREINGALDLILNAYGGDERRRWGVENSGICLLLAWTNELISQMEQH